MFIEAPFCCLTPFASITLYCIMIPGRHVRRAALPRPAGRPGCSSSLILVPLWEQPVIFVINWSGELVHTLGSAELGLTSKDRGFVVSPVQDGVFHFWVAPAGRGPQIYTYKVRFEIHTYKVKNHLLVTDCSGYISIRQVNRFFIIY